MSKQSKNETETQAYLNPAVENDLYGAFSQYNPFTTAMGFGMGYNPDVYTGERVAGFSDNQNSAYDLASSLFGSDYLSGAKNAVGSLLGGNMVDTSQIQSALDGDGVTTQANSQLLQGVANDAINNATSQYALGGRLGSDAFGQGLGRGVTRAMGDVMAADADRQLKADLSNQMNTGNLLSLLTGADTTNANLVNTGINAAGNLLGMDQSIINSLTGTGGMMQDQGQAELDANMALINDQNASMEQRFNALMALTGAAGYAPTSTTSTETKTPGLFDYITGGLEAYGKMIGGGGGGGGGATGE